MKQLAATKDTSIKLKMYKQTITQLGICRVKLEHNDKLKMYNFFVFPGTEQALLGMPDNELLKTPTIKCNTIGTDKEDKDENCSTNRPKTAMQEVSDTVQIQDWKEAVQKQTAAQTAIQMQAVIQI